MDFTLPVEVEEAAQLAATILSDQTTPERLVAAEATPGARFDAQLWAALNDAGLLDLAPAEDADGAGLGVIGLCRFLIEVGRTVAPIPAAVDGAVRLFLSENGVTAPSGEGTSRNVLTWAITEQHDYTPVNPTSTATPSGDGFALSGTKYLVPAATIASHLAVTASTPAGTAVFLIPTDAPGLTINEQTLSDTDVVGLVEFDGVTVGADQVIGSTDGSAATRFVQLATIANCALQLGITEGAVRLTAQYAKEREQFDRPIATFQAVAQRLADGFIDTRFQGLTMWQAAWRLSEGLPAADAVATAKLWAADAGHRVAHTTVHIHGGVGIDLDGVAHRYFTAATRFEQELGGATQHALERGRLLATNPA